MILGNLKMISEDRLNISISRNIYIPKFYKTKLIEDDHRWRHHNDRTTNTQKQQKSLNHLNYKHYVTNYTQLSHQKIDKNDLKLLTTNRLHARLHKFSKQQTK